MNRAIVIGPHSVGEGQPPLVVAEMSGNHNRSLERALELVDAAATAGAHALKLQTYTPDSLTIDCDSEQFRITDPASPWNGDTLYQLYQKAATPWEWHQPIFERCRTRGLLCFSTPFDEAAVEFLESLGVPAYKIAAFENGHLPLVRKVAATGKPLLLSTGMATVAELDETVRAARAAGCADLVLLKCTSSYPALPENSNLATIPHLRELFGCPVGLSDHTTGIGAAVAAVAFGAAVIEKHFTLSRADGGVDAGFSLEPGELSALVTETRRAWQALGSVVYGPTVPEGASVKFRRSLYVTTAMKKGERFGPNNLRAIRPGYGLPPKHLELFIGKRAARDIGRGSALTWDMLVPGDP